MCNCRIGHFASDDSYTLYDMRCKKLICFLRFQERQCDSYTFSGIQKNQKLKKKSKVTDPKTPGGQGWAATLATAATLFFETGWPLQGASSPAAGDQPIRRRMLGWSGFSGSRQSSRPRPGHPEFWDWRHALLNPRELTAGVCAFQLGEVC